MVDEVEKPSKDNDSESAAEEDNRKSNGWLVAMVISGGHPMEGWETMTIMKRKWKEIMTVSSTSVAEINSHRPPQHSVIATSWTVTPTSKSLS